MKEHPILFTGSMVRAILDGRKTQTRRVVKPQPPPSNWRHDGVGDVDKNDSDADHECHWLEQLDEHGRPFHFEKYRCIGKCPYGVPGDRLWVREAWCDSIYRDNDKCPDGPCYKATDDGECCIDGRRWSPSIHMPRSASRITLYVTNIRVERVQDINYDAGDIWAEGIPATHDREAEVREFKDLWDSINEKRGFGWDANPWVWVVEFKRVE